MKGTLYGVGVGPGDPELMTLKAVRMIRENEIIAVPGADVKETVAYKIAVQAVPELEEKELQIELTEAAKDFVVEGGYDPMYGARPLKRYLQKNVETLAARLILAGNVGRGDTILIDVRDGKLEAVVKQG